MTYSKVVINSNYNSCAQAIYFLIANVSISYFILFENNKNILLQEKPLQNVDILYIKYNIFNYL